jgi:WXG100 family type VII secretion target
MAHIAQVNYDETNSIAKNMHSDGDDLVQLHSQTRQRVQALRSEWVGDAAEAFFEEMEGELLPALQRVSGGLFMGVEILNKIMKIIHEADEETAQYFKNDLNDDFGAGLFGSALDGVPGSVPGGTTAGDDFGASKFEDALQAGQGDPSQPGTAGQESSASAGSQYMEMQPPSSTDTPAAETPPAETQAAPEAGGGGGGGGGSSQGMQGDLQGLGTGVGGNAQAVNTVGGGPQGMPDHIYEGSTGGSAGAGTPQTGSTVGSGAPQEQSSGGLAGAAGVAGVLGAAAAGAAKILKNENDEPGEGV